MSMEKPLDLAGYMEQGLPLKAAQHALAHAQANPPPPVEVWDCHWTAFLLFRALIYRNCWVVAFGGPLRLDGGEVERTARRQRLKLTDGLWRKLEIMESEALRILAEKK